MARRRQDTKRKLDHLDHDQEDELLEGPMTPVETVTGEPRPENARSAFSDDDERREAWQLHRDRLLAEHGEAWAALVYDKGLDHAAAYRALQPDDDPPASSLPVLVETHDGVEIVLSSAKQRDDVMVGDMPTGLPSPSSARRVVIAISAVRDWRFVAERERGRRPRGVERE